MCRALDNVTPKPKHLPTLLVAVRHICINRTDTDKTMQIAIVETRSLKMTFMHRLFVCLFVGSSIIHHLSLLTSHPVSLIA